MKHRTGGLRRRMSINGGVRHVNTPPYRGTALHSAIGCLGPRWVASIGTSQEDILAEVTNKLADAVDRAICYGLDGVRTGPLTESERVTVIVALARSLGHDYGRGMPARRIGFVVEDHRIPHRRMSGIDTTMLRALKAGVDTLWEMRCIRADPDPDMFTEPAPAYPAARSTLRIHAAVSLAMMSRTSVTNTMLLLKDVF
jgi:hypothetical protein